MPVRFTKRAPNLGIACYFFDGNTPLSDTSGLTNISVPSDRRPLHQITGTDGKAALAVQFNGFKWMHPHDKPASASAACMLHARNLGIDRLIYHVESMPLEQFSQFALGIHLAEYEFVKYKGNTGKTKRHGIDIAINAGPRERKFREAGSAAEKLGTGVNYARDLANTPGSDLVPEQLAAEAANLAKRYGFKFTKLSKAQLKQQGYAGCLAVGQASEHPPVLFSLEYKPKKTKAGTKPICFVGKGITFDTGGISLKPWDGMWDMKADMGGSAAVLGIFKAIGELQPSCPVVGVVASAENMPGGKAYLPGDVLRYKNGRTVEIKSTDAEGRLVLADALIHAQRKLKQHRIVEFSTLTGACARALGKPYIGLMSNFPELAGRVKAASESSGELVWELPLHPEYRAMINSPVADIKNSGGPVAGAQTAGWFLHEFIDEGTEYVHLDIAGAFLADKAEKYWSQPGATGAGVRVGYALIST